MFANENTLFERVNLLGIFKLNETDLRYGYKLGNCQLERIYWSRGLLVDSLTNVNA